MKPLSCSIIVSTYNRASYLQRLLASLGHLRGTEFEVIVVNGPSTDKTAVILDDFLGRIKAVDCPTRNLSHSRNLGIAAAAGDIIVFIDDDALPSDEAWLLRFVSAYTNDNEGLLGGVGGAVLHGNTDRFEFKNGATSDYGLQVFEQSKLNNLLLDGNRWVCGIPGGNNALRRSALIQVGGFDEFYVYYLDETDVCVRLSRAGYHILSLPENGIRHFAARANQPNSISNNRWRTITRSDTYFALKNGADSLPLRLLKTIYLAPQKHFYREMVSFMGQKGIPLKKRAELMTQWLTGFLEGLLAGLFRTRHLGDFITPNPTFLPFNPPQPEQPLHIALLTQTIPGQPNYGGVGRYTFDLANGLHERGHEVHIICKDEQFVQYQSLGFVIHGIPASEYASCQIDPGRPVLSKNLSYSLAVVRKFTDLYAQGISFDVVHASNWDAEAIALIRAQVYPTVLMLVSPLAQVINTEKWIVNDDLKACVALDRWQIEQADTICIPSKGVLASYQYLMNIDPDSLPSLNVTPLGIKPVNGSTPKQTTKRIRKILFVGRLERRKGVHTLLEVLPELLTTYQGWECHLVGNDRLSLAEGGTLKERFLSQYSGAPWLKRVVFHGEVNEGELQQHYQDCDLFVAPSLFESFGLIFHEAMQFGKAVVGCRTGGIPEVVQDGVEGLLVKPDCPDELREALARLMADDGLRQCMGQAGEQRVYNRSNYRTMAEGLEKVYLESITRVGERRRAKRECFWPKEVPLFQPSPLVRIKGNWKTKENNLSLLYLMGKPGAEIHAQAWGDSMLRLVCLRHPWSGILEIQFNGSVLRYLNLYKPGESEPQYCFALLLPGNPQDLYEVTLRVLQERHPESHASEVWINRLTMHCHPWINGL